MARPFRVVQYGIGPIGLECIRTLLKKQSGGKVQLVGAIDVDPTKVGKDVGELLGDGQTTGVVVSPNAERLFDDVDPDVVIHTTTSFLGSMHDQLLKCAAAGVNVVSSTEELSFPFERYPEISAQLDRAARDNDVTILGTGVNPGYAMDALALFATGVSTLVNRVTVERVVDAGKRRGPLQRKVGAGLDVAAFEERKATGKFGHIGLRESLLLIAAGLDWQMGEIHEQLEAVVSTRDIKTEHANVAKGEVAGIHHSIVGRAKGERRISLDLKMYVGAEEPYDAVVVDGTPPIDLRIRDGIFGDTATVAALINAIPLVFDAPPGLQTVKDLPLPRAFAAES